MKINRCRNTVLLAILLVVCCPVTVLADDLELLCSGNASHDGDIVDGSTDLAVRIDKDKKLLKITWGTVTIVDAVAKEEPNRFFYYKGSNGQIDTFFEVNRTTLDFRFMRMMLSTTGKRSFLVSKGICSIGERKI